MRATYAIPLCLALVVMGAGQALADAAVSPACPTGEAQMRRTELIFGSERAGAAPVSDAEWRDFLDAEIATRFPDGFTTYEANGGWRGAHGVVRESSHVLLVWSDGAEGASKKFEELRALYRKRFSQESVLRADETDCVSF